MQEGFVADCADGAVFPNAWSPGKPQKSFWGSIKIEEKDRRVIASFRCEQCGFLESYAP